MGKRESYRTPYRRSSSSEIKISLFRSGKLSIVKNGLFTYDFYHSVLQGIREFDLKNPNIIRSYQVVVFAWAEDMNREMSATVQNLTHPRFRQDDKEKFKELEEKAENSFDADSGGSSHEYHIRFMRIIIVAWKDWKEKYDVIKKERSEKQKKGREESKIELELQKREKELARIRHEREKNKKLRELGMLAPARKKPHSKRKVWI